jgi:hypothetical protein
MKKLQAGTITLGDGSDDLRPIAYPLRITEQDIVRWVRAKDEWLEEGNLFVFESLLPTQ